MTIWIAFFLAALVAVNLCGGARAEPVSAVGGGVAVTASDWETRRRPEVLDLFREHVYGRNAVGRPESLRCERVDGERPAFDGFGTRSQVRITYAGPGGEGGIGVTIFYPTKGKPKGCLVLIVNRSRRIIDEAESNPAEFWPVRDILEQGYATAAFHNSDVVPDRAADAFGSGVFGVFDPRNEPRAANAWGAIAAWAWGASRVLDYLETDPRLDGVPFAVAGHSRGGKAALWCGAQDRRVALTISNNSGRTGAALGRVMRGETVREINTTFPHWFAANYHAYNERPDDLPVDQHLLLGLIAPRLVYVASASEDAHADPAAEFQSCVEAAPVFALYGKEGVGSAVMPGVGEERHEGSIGYHFRAGPHDLRREDWQRYLEFADRWFR